MPISSMLFFEFFAPPEDLSHTPFGELVDEPWKDQELEYVRAHLLLPPLEFLRSIAEAEQDPPHSAHQKMLHIPLSRVYDEYTPLAYF